MRSNSSLPTEIVFIGVSVVCDHFSENDENMASCQTDLHNLYVPQSASLLYFMGVQVVENVENNHRACSM